MKKTVHDQLGRTVQFTFPPQRIISLVPSLSELLFDLGLEKNIVGVTKFCVHPEKAKKQCTIVGGTKNFRFQTIKELEPDLIIANKEENYQEGIEELEKLGLPVWVSDIYTFEDALQTILDIGKITNKEDESKTLVGEISASFEDLSEDNNKSNNKSVAYIIWKNPIMAAADTTFIHELITKSGFKNILKNQERYPEIEISSLRELAPDYIFLSSEPFPFKDKDLKEFETLFPESKVILVDGELFSWYGSRMKLFPEYIKQLKIKLNQLHRDEFIS